MTVNTPSLSPPLKGCNLGRSCDKYYQKFPLCILAHNGARYDFLFLLRGLAEHAMNEYVTYTRDDGSVYRLPLLRSTPRVVFKTTNEVVGLTLAFTCPRENCQCKTPDHTRLEKRLKGEKSRSCPYTRKLKFIDSFLFTNASLDKMVNDLNVAGTNENLSLDKIFPACRNFANTMGFSQAQFKRITEGKLHYPYEYLDCLKDLELQTTPPPPTAFKSLLKNSPAFAEEAWDNFKETWALFKIQSMKHLLKLYNTIDW